MMKYEYDNVINHKSNTNNIVTSDFSYSKIQSADMKFSTRQYI